MLENIKISENTYRILNAGCDCYLLDSSHPVLIDCGCSKDNIRAYCESIINKKVDAVICTHSHIDHTGSCGLFEHVYMTKETALGAKNPMDEKIAYLHLDYKPILIQDNQTMDFGGRCLKILLCDCHAPGNIMILDKDNKLLFTGDEIDKDQVLLLPGFAVKKYEYHYNNAATVLDYKRMLKKIWSINNDYDLLCTGHNGSPLLKDTISKMIKLCDSILNGNVGTRDCSSTTYNNTYTHFPFPQANYRRYSEDGLSLVYCADSLIDRSKNNLYTPATPLHQMCSDNLHIN